MKTLQICLENDGPVEIELTDKQFKLLMNRFNTGGAKDPNGKLIVRSVDILDHERANQDGLYHNNEYGYNWAYATTGRMSHPSDNK